MGFDQVAGIARGGVVKVALAAGLVVIGMVLSIAYAPQAQAAGGTFYVRDGGTGTDCTLIDPCGTVQEAVDAHRVAPDPEDVIDIGPGLFVGNVGAGEPEDDGLTIRGTLNSGTGARETTLRGTDFGFDDLDIAVLLGFCGQAEVTLRDVAVDTEGADSFVEAISLEGGSDLENVHAQNQTAVPSDAQAVVDVCQRGTQISDSEIVGADEDAGLFVSDGAKLTDTTITADEAPAVVDFAFFDSRPLTIRRSQLSSTDDTVPVLVGSSNLIVDSSLITGGEQGIVPFAIDKWQINNSTIDAGDPGVSDTDTPSLLLDPSLPDPSSQVNVDSSLLVDGIDASFGDGTFTCVYSDLPAPLVGPDWVDQCPIGSGGNVTNDPDDLFVGLAGPPPYDWALKPTSPAIDSGQGGPVPPGMSNTDLIGNPRLVAGIVSDCATPVRDKGAYEYVGPPCSLQAPKLTNGTAPMVGTKLGGNPGKWSNSPTGFQNQFLRCDELGDNCTPIQSYRTGRAAYIAKAADVGSTLRVRYIASNAAGDSDPAVSLPSDVVGQDVPVNVTPPTIVNGASPTVGTALHSTAGDWTNTPTSYLRQWLRCDASGDNCTAITAYRERRTYTPRGADVGSTLRVSVKATNAGGDSAPATSEASGVVG